MSGEWLFIFPLWGPPAQGTGPFTVHVSQTAYVQGVRGAGSQPPPPHPRTPPQPVTYHTVGRRVGRRPPQGRVLASGVGSKMGGSSPVLSRGPGLESGHVLGCMFFEASIMIFKQ